MSATAARRGAPDRLTVAALIGLTAVAFALRLAGLGQSLFGDEIYTHDIVALPGLGEMLTEVHDTSLTPPLHYVLAWTATKLGDPTITSRLPSLLLGTATVPLLWALGRRTVGPQAGLIAAALFALDPFAIFFGDQARAYATLVFLVTLSTLSLLEALDRGEARWWITYAVTSVAIVLTHYTGIFVLGVQALWAALAHREQIRPLVLANLGAVAAYAPWVPAALHQQASHNAAIGLFYRETLENIVAAIARLVIGHGHQVVVFDQVPGPVGLGLICGGLGAALAGAIRGGRAGGRTWRPSSRTVLVAALALATPVGLLLYGLVGAQLYSPRSLSASQPAILLALAALLAAVRGPARAVPVAFVMAGMAIGAVSSLLEDHRRPAFKQAAELIDARAGPGDTVAVLNTTGTRNVRARDQALRSLEVNFEAPYERYGFATIDDLRALDPETGGRRLFVLGFPAFDTLLNDPPLHVRMPLVGRTVLPGFADLIVWEYEVVGT